ncbi:MAG TPA: hypothetical protein VHM29_06230, partial [Acidimicrobiia bacterium]|nr:hypothetical protein [Acidimicrobiia bacterium]
MSGPLSTLYRVVGPGQAVLMTSFCFGMSHYFGGIPSGAIGALQAGLLALFLGRAMLDTKGPRLALDHPHRARHRHVRVD